MPPAAPSRFAAFDILRGILILHVVLYHAAVAVEPHLVRWDGLSWDPHAFPLAQSLFQAVFLQSVQAPSLFFLLSGFLLHGSRRRQPGEPWGPFILRRSSRLYVGYAVALVLFALVLPWRRIDPRSAGDLLDLLAHAALLHNLQQQTLWSFNASFWYVATEVQLCLLYPVWMALVSRLGWTRTMAVLAGIEIGARVLCTVLQLGDPAGAPVTLGDVALARGPAAYVFTWMLGAWLHEQWAQGHLRRPETWQLVVTPLLVVAATVVRPLTVLAPTIASLAVLGGFQWLLTREPSGVAAPGTVARVFSWIGSLSLGIFLLNQPIVERLARFAAWRIAAPVPRMVIVAAAATVVLVPLAWLLQRYVEQPLHARFLRSLAARGRALRAA